MNEPLFDLSEEYESMLNKGISLSGENMSFFINGRLKAVLSHLSSLDKKVNRVLDFGCGLGFATRQLADAFPGASIVGVDTSEGALASARRNNGGECIKYLTLSEFEADVESYDLCYVNGVFHHIPIQERESAIKLIANHLAPQGLLYLFENNPWNPGARLVMSRIPFDRDAIMLSVLETERLAASADLVPLERSSLFFFPKVLSVFRPLEFLLSPTLLGAQYFVVSQKL